MLGTIRLAIPQRPLGVSLAAFGGNWVNAMAAAHSAGNLITVPAGIWPSPQVVPYQGLTILGAGPSAIVSKVAATAQDNTATPSTSPIFQVTVPNVTITDITIRGWPIGSGLSDDIGIAGTEATNLTVQRVLIENMQGVGIQIQGTNGNMAGGLFEDITVNNTLFRNNGAHGVGIWLYKGARNCTLRRITTNTSANSGIALDAGTAGDIDAKSVDNNVFQTINISNSGGTLGGILLTGAAGNVFTDTTITDLATGPATAWGADQSGLTSTGNTFTNVTLANITTADFMWTDQCSNTFNNIAGVWHVRNDPTVCNTYNNCPNLVLH